MESGKLAIYVGKKIREYRKKKGLTQKELGEKIGVKHNTISNYETGAASPEQDALFALSRALDVKVDNFFPSGEGSQLDQAVQISNENFDVTDLDFLNKLIRQAAALNGDDRKRFMDNIRFAVEYFDKANK